MDPKEALIEDLRTLNRIFEILNQSPDVHSALNASLQHLVELMGLKTGWITLPARWADSGQKSVEWVADSLLHELEDFVGSTPQSDDLTIMVLRRLPLH